MNFDEIKNSIKKSLESQANSKSALSFFDIKDKVLNTFGGVTDIASTII